METATNSQPTPHMHHCAAHPEIHAPGRETPANMVKGEYVGGYDPKACECGNPSAPQCCANHPTADPNYHPRRIGDDRIAGYAEELRIHKAKLGDIGEDVKELKAQVAVLTAEVAKLGGMRTV